MKTTWKILIKVVAIAAVYLMDHPFKESFIIDDNIWKGKALH